MSHERRRRAVLTPVAAVGLSLVAVLSAGGLGDPSLAEVTGGASVVVTDALPAAAQRSQSPSLAVQVTSRTPTSATLRVTGRVPERSRALVERVRDGQSTGEGIWAFVTGTNFVAEFAIAGPGSREQVRVTATVGPRTVRASRTLTVISWAEYQHQQDASADAARDQAAREEAARKAAYEAGTTGSPSSWAPVRRGSNGTPLTWNMCTPIAIYVNTSGAPAWGKSLIEDALSDVGKAVGTTVVYRGTTKVTPYVTQNWYESVPDHSIAIGWGHGARVPALRDYAGLGGAASRGDRIFAGGVLFNLDVDMTPAKWRLVLLHELGHAFNLAHVSDTTQVMAPGSYPPDRYRATYQAGDRAGLAALRDYTGCS